MPFRAKRRSDKQKTLLFRAERGLIAEIILIKENISTF